MIIAHHILAGIVNCKSYGKKVIPFLKPEYFQTFEDTYVFKLMRKYMATYKAFPTLSSLKLELSNVKDLSESGFNDVSELIDRIFQIEFDYTEEYLVKLTETWIQGRALDNALLKSILLREKGENVESIPDLLRRALAISFESSCGFEIFDDKSIDERYTLYQNKSQKFSTGIQRLDELTNGGLEPKAISVFFGGSGTGKSSLMIAMAANMAKAGHDVLYITLELSEEKVSQRFEASFMDEYINDISRMSEDEYKSGLRKLKGSSLGRVVVKEYPTSIATVHHFESLLDELAIKRNFVPKIVVVDYINLMRSVRYSNETSYTIIKGITEELRGLAVEKQICLISATQGNKATNDSKLTDLDATSVAESNGLLATVDFLAGLIYSEDLREQKTQIVKIVKNRFSEFVNVKFPIRVEHDKCRVYDNDDDMQLYGKLEVDDKLEKEKKRQGKKKIELKFKDKGLDEDLFDT